MFRVLQQRQTESVFRVFLLQGNTAVQRREITDCVGILRRDGKVAKELDIAPEKLFYIINKVSENALTRKAGRNVLVAVICEGVDPEVYAKENNLFSQNDSAALEEVCKRIVDANPQAVEDYKNGKTKAIQALFGSVMRELRGTGDPAVIKKILLEMLSK